MSVEPTEPTEPTARKARPVELDPSATLAEAFAAVVAECCDQWRTNEADLLRDRDAAALHQTRVGLRRLRSALSLLRPWLGELPGYAALRADLREHTLPLGPARDLDVLLEGPLVADLRPDQVTLLRAARHAAYDIVVTDLRLPAWEGVGTQVDALVAAVSGSGVARSTGARMVADAALERRWRRVVRRGRHLRELTAGQRHEVRIEAKKLRYGAQFFVGLYPAVEAGVAAGVAAPLELADVVGALQDALGAANDAHVAGELLASVGAPAPEVDEEALLAASEAAWADVAAQRPFWH